MKQILDACCGSKMFYFNKNNKNVLFMDKRELHTTLCDGRKLDIEPDLIADFTKMPEDYCIEFQKAYRKNAEKMLFKVKGVTIHNGKDTDLKVDDYVFDFELGERIR